MSAWLKKYYSPNEIANLNPAVVLDGKDYAVVKLTKGGEGGPARVAYVGLWKGGRNNVSSHTSLWEGPASDAAMYHFKQWLEQVDAK